jgi:ice-binding like protein/PEP-CTERM motif-containing protein
MKMRPVCLLVLTLTVLPVLARGASAESILLSQLRSFAVLGASAVTNVPTSTIVGNVGVAPGSSITGFNSSPGVAVADAQVTSGLVHATTAVAANAQSQLTIARNELALLGPGTVLGADLAGRTLTSGVYTVAPGVSNLTGTLTLDGEGNANAFWVFQMPSTLITSPGSVVNVINAGSNAGLFWNVGSSATLDTTTSFQGNILALTSIALNNGATIGCGRALADTGAVTMDMNTVSIGCANTGGQGSNGLGGGLYVPGGGGTPSPVPEPTTWLLSGIAIAGMVGYTRRRRPQPVSSIG